MRKDGKEIRKGKVYYLTMDGKVISNFDIANAYYILNGKRIDAHDYKWLESIVKDCKGIVKELDDLEAMDIVDDFTRRGKYGTVKIN